MAETNLIMTNDDAEELIGAILGKGAYLIPNCHYKKYDYEILCDVESYVKYHKITKLFFIIHDDWFIEPLPLRKTKHKTEGEIYYIMQKTGGPALDFYFTGEFEKDGQNYVGTASLGYYSKSWIDIEDDYVKAPKSLKDFYRQLVSPFKKNGVLYASKHKKYWASKKAVQLLDSGEKKLYFDFLEKQ